jgi:hypothetical protein
MEGFYTLTPKSLLEKARREIVDFHESNSLERLFDACCTLNHLRDWICPNVDARRASRNWPEGPEERLAAELWEMHEYQIVRGLCNRAKHFVFTKKNSDPVTGIVHGACVGLARCGDSLGQTYYLVGVNGVAHQDVRDLLIAVLCKYLAYFGAKGEQFESNGFERKAAGGAG